MDDGMNLRELGVKGYIFLSMKAEDTIQNSAIHSGFREMAEIECRNDYTMALGKLLEYYEEDAKTQMLYREIESLRTEVASLKKSIKEQKEEKDDGVF